MFNEKCNCGRDARYTSLTGEKSSCNKYNLCPTYAELEEELKKYKCMYGEVLEAACSLRFFREGTDYYTEAEDIIVKHKGE